MKRYLNLQLEQDALASRKIAILSGPRQVGKTTLARQLLTSPLNYFSWDADAFRKAWARDAVAALSERGPGPVVLDEIHKDRRWKRKLKGVYDLKGDRIPLIVTGSARMDLFRRGGDSLLGRFLPFRLHPFTVGERETPPSPDDLGSGPRLAFPWRDLMRLGGFPEPLLRGDSRWAARWSRLRRERLLAEDVRDLRNVSDLSALKLLADFLPERVGSLLSMNSLREDVGVAYATVRDWIHVLEALYFGFFVRPFTGRLTRMVRAEPKFYLYDILSIPQEPQRRENLAALHLLKSCHYWTDAAHGTFDLCFLRTKDKEEVDFCIVRDGKPWLLAECKSQDSAPSQVLARFAGRLKTRLNFQLVDRPGFQRDDPEHGITIVDYERFFGRLV